MRHLIAPAIATALGAFITLGLISAAPAAAAAPVCGYYAQHGTAYYNNCSSFPVTIEIDDWGGNTFMCVGADTTANLGDDSDISDVWIVNTGC
jgi:Family of unknown function (DUF6355)